MKRTRWMIFFAGLMLLAPVTSRAQSSYTIQSLVNAGDTIAGVKLAPFNETDFGILGLNDNGELVFSALDTNGNRVLFDYNGGKFTRIAGEGDTIGGVVITALTDGSSGPTINGQTLFFAWDVNQNGLMFQYAAGKTTLIAGPGTPVPGGKIAAGGVGGPVSMNWQGNAVFGALMTPTTPYPPGIHIPTQPAVFLWNAAKQQLTTVAGPGTKLGDLTILSAMGGDAPVINNNNEMVVNVSGSLSAAPFYLNGLLFIGADGKTQPIAQYGQKLPDGNTTSGGVQPVLNDAGVVAFVARPGPGAAYYLWDKATGSIVGPIITVGQDAGNGQKVARIEVFGLDRFTTSGMIQTRLDDSRFGRHALFRFLTWPGKPGTQGASVASAPARIAGEKCDEFLSSYKVNYENAFSPFGIILWPTLQQLALDCIGEGKAEGWIDKSDPWLPSPGVPPNLDQIETLRDVLHEHEDAAAAAAMAAAMAATNAQAQAQAQAAIDALMQQFAQAISSQHGGSGQRRRNAREASGPPGPFFSLATPGIYLTETSTGAEVAYWIGTDGQFKLLLQDGMTTSVGKIRQVYDFSLHWGSNASWNDYYQVALVADVGAGPGGLEDAILLLTPTAAP